MQFAGEHSKQYSQVHAVVADLTDCYTWSFPEFIPFCSGLYYFSSFKAFDAAFPL
ncbi:MAG: hypothetical protein ACO1OO_12485 [Flavisolibacter sp.]